jgi:hypothetical protein
MTQPHTVAELIEKLQQFRPDAQVMIEDADTNWRIATFEVSVDPVQNWVWITPCGYHEMEKD